MPDSSPGLAPYSSSPETTRWILSQRPPKNRMDPRQPYSSVIDVEPASGFPVPELRSVWTLFLTNKECPWRCLMCDLWKNTLDETLPAGAILEQLDLGLAQLLILEGNSTQPARPRWLKLYNSGSFFDPTAIPPADYPGILARVAGFERLIVECHPSLIPSRMDPFLEAFRESFGSGTKPKLEVAMGLETAHPPALERLNKRMTVADFEQAAHELRRRDISIRVFLLVHPPFLAPAEAREALQVSLKCAFDAGASVVSLIPTRAGNGAMDTLAREGHFTEPSLIELEQCLESALDLGRGRVFADLWDLERFSSCALCFPLRLRRLEQMNLTQMRQPRVLCDRCGSIPH